MKTLITGGCSFSECISSHMQTWPKQLANILDTEYIHISTAMGSQGNGLISRRILYRLLEELKTTKAEDILVGIMWSGPGRHDFYHSEKVHFDVSEPWQENPTKFVKNTPGSWAILNHNWQNTYARTYYKNFHDIFGSLVYTLEHILRIQWFLKLHNIKYFMATYTSEVFPKEYMNHPEVKYLYEQVDKSKFLSIEGEYEWCVKNMPNDFMEPGNNHPSNVQHKAFTEQVIIPFLKEKHYI
jgi:hypothetical protein